MTQQMGIKAILEGEQCWICRAHRKEAFVTPLVLGLRESLGAIASRSGQHNCLIR